MTTTCILAWAAILLALPVIIILWATESKDQSQLRQIKAMRKQGLSLRAIGQALGISHTTVRRRLAA